MDRLRVVDPRPSKPHVYKATRRSLLHQSRAAPGTLKVGSRMVLGAMVASGGGVVTKVFKVFSQDGELKVPHIQFIDVHTVLKTVEIRVLFQRSGGIWRQRGQREVR